VDKKSNRKNLLSFLLPLLLVLIAIFLCYRNYSPNTFLTGWDTLHPEFNLKIYWNRIIFGAWQSHQGLGAMSSQAHASEIPRVIIVSLLDLFFAKDLIRYLYAFLMLILGPLGVYFLIKKKILKDMGGNLSSVGAFCGGLFYLLNLGTLQNFNVPLEMFLTHYGLIGWSFLFITNFYEEGRKKALLKFILVSLLIIPQSHTPTLFYVYFMSTAVYLTVLILNGVFFKKRSDKTVTRPSVKRAFIVLILVLLSNLFWLLPNIYYGLDKGKEVPLSKIHHLFSDEAFLVSKKYGNLKDVSILKSFLFDWGVYAGENSYTDLLDSWITHLENPLVSVIGYTLSSFVLAGLVLSIVKRNRYAMAWGILGLMSVFFIFNVNPPFGFIFGFLQNNIPLFKELLRFPFTKFSIMLALVYSIFFGYFISVSCELIAKKFSKFAVPLFVLLVSSGLVFFSLPAFKGYLINPAMRVDIPDRYFDMFSYFDSQKEYGRVAELPIHSFWGWETYSWNTRGTGYQGAGFLWFGIKQPLLDREFDRWNIANEQPYRELSVAVYSEDSSLLQKTLEKYKIRWLILDESLVAPGLDNKVLFYAQIKKLLSGTAGIVLDKDFGGGLAVYRYTPQIDYSRTEDVDSYHVVSNSLFKEYSDPAYLEYGNYIEGDGIKYQFLGVNSVDENIDNTMIFSDEKAVYFKLPASQNTVVATRNVPTSMFLRGTGTDKFVEFVFGESVVGRVVLPFIGSDKLFVKINKDVFDLSLVKNDGFIGNVILSIESAPEISIYKMGQKREVGNFLYSKLENCDPSEAGNNSAYSLSAIAGGFEISARDTMACVTFSLTDVVSVNHSDLILVDFKSDTPISLSDFCMLNNSTGLCANKFMGGGQFLTVLTEEANNYALRFFVDARNSNVEIKRNYKDVVVYNTDLIYRGNVQINVKDGIKMGEFLVFNKLDQFTLQPKDMPGNRRVCKQGLSTSNSNFLDSGKGLVFNSTEGSLCDSYGFPLAAHNTGYVLEIRASYYDGVPLRICLTNEYSKRCDLEVSLPAQKSEGTYFYIVPPMGNGVGYTANVSNFVFGNTMSRNELQYVSLVPISYDLVKNVKTGDSNVVRGSKIFVLNEAYDSGWVAFCGLKICEAKHVKVNNWANGWVFEKNLPTRVTPIFWPQITEFIGFLVWIPLLVFSFKYKEKQELEEVIGNTVSLPSHSVDNV
jgi:hypothetical protein